MVQGLLMELKDYNCWSIAEAAGHSGPHRLQTGPIPRERLSSQVNEQWAFLNKIGLTGLENLGGTGAGFSAADAQTVLNMINNMQTVQGVYKGTVQQGGSGGTGATLFNFEDALTPLWAGQ
jgi:hypothetical protein